MNENLLKLTVLLPLLGATIIGLVGFLSQEFRKMEKVIGFLATSMVAIPFVIYLTTFLSYSGEPVYFSVIPEWIIGPKLNVGFTYVLDELSLVMGMIVTGIGSLIHLYSTSYMHGDRGFYKYFLYLNLFIFAMTNLILGDNLVVLFLGWEGVGACSYFLIGYWYEDMKKAAAAQKAFVANRVGDFAMICAMFILYHETGSLSFREILAHGLGTGAAASACALMFIASTGKSAQIPLYVWLPDAMAGPTPVSALIHAATMVTSGIYLTARLSDLFVMAPAVMAVISVVGGLTAILAALIALTQNDIKKVLAYSTVSQLGFMFMALGAGAFTTAIFHVMTHAFFKACLFLGSGSVIHAMDHTHAVDDPQDVRTMGNLKKYMPHTRMTFFISTLAIAGIPGLAGFFSKDEILSKVFANGYENAVYFFVWGIGSFTAFLTAFYMTRVYHLTFEGAERFPMAADHGDAHHGNKHNDKGHDTHGDGHGHAHEKHLPHESPALMTIPLWVLAIMAIVGGYVGLPAVIGHGHFHFFNHWLEGAVNLDYVEDIVHHNVSLGMEWGLIVLSILIAFSGVLVSWKLYTQHHVQGDAIIRKRLGGLYKIMENKFYVDELYNMVLIHPFVFLGENVIMFFDKYVIDGAVNGLAWLVGFWGDTFKRSQTGVLSNYTLYLAAGVVVLLTYLMLG